MSAKEPHINITLNRVLTWVAIIALIVTLWKPIYSLTRLPDALNNLASAVHELKDSQIAMDKRVGGLETGQASLGATETEQGKQLQNHETRITKLER